MKRFKSLTICLITIFIFASCSLTRDDLPEEPDKETVTEDEENSVSKKDKDKDEKHKKKKAELSDDLNDYTFGLCGDVYSLPTTLDVFEERGWEIKESFDMPEYVKGDDYELVYLTRGDDQIIVYMVNKSGDIRKTEECKVGGICVYDHDLEDANDFRIARKITLNSTAEDIINAFGEPDQSMVTETSTFYRYGESAENYTTIDIYTDIVDSASKKIEIWNIVKEDSDRTKTGEEVPEYLSKYTAPDEMGDITEPIVEIDGKLYSIPCPVKELIDDGWKIVMSNGSVPAKNTSNIDMEKDGKTLTLEIYNDAEYQTTEENCVVTMLMVMNIGEDFPVADIRFANDISIETEWSEDVDAFLKDSGFTCDEFDTTITYSYYTSHIDTYVTIDFDVKSGKCEYIFLSNKDIQYN